MVLSDVVKYDVVFFKAFGAARTHVWHVHISVRVASKSC